MNKRYDCLLFDMDGTVADTSEGITAGLEYAVRQLNLRNLTGEQERSFLGPPLKKSFMDVYGMNDEEAAGAVSVFRKYYSAKGLMQCSPYPGLCETIRKLHAEGTRLFVATSKPTPFAQKIVEKFGITDCFDAVAGSNLDNSRGRKSDIIRYVIDSCPGGGELSWLMVGDTFNDIEGARECGIDSLGVTYGYGTREELIHAGATYIIDAPEQISRFGKGV